MAMTLEGARMQAIQTLEEARITITEAKECFIFMFRESQL